MNGIREKTSEKVKELLDKQLLELFTTWDEIGMKKDTLETYSDQVYNHIAGLMKDMIDESLQKKRDILKNVKILAQSARKLAKELDTEFKTDSYDNLPLLELDVKLKEKVDELQNLKEQRLNYIEQLKSKEIEICKKLGTRPVGFSSELPNDQEIQQFDSYLEEQENEKIRLAEIFRITRRAIVKMMDDLVIEPALEFEKMIYQDSSNFVFSANNMNKLRDLKDRLKDQTEQAKTQAKEKRETLSALWEYLDEPREIRQAFLDTYTGFSLVTINALNAEIKRCKEKRSENIANYVSKVRSEIENLWKLCKYSELQKRSFTAMKCQTYTDDLLTLHEIEAEKLRKYYDENRKIFELLNEWEVQFEKLKELDQRANDPDRYHNRGGQLLMEEKERKAAEKKLPKIEIQLSSLIEEFETIHKKTFLINGLSLKEYMDQAREKYELEKENMKLARKQAKDKSVRNTPLSTSKRTPGMSMLRVTPASARLRTPGATTLSRTNLSRITPSAKRKLPYDISPKSENKKRAMSTEKHKGTVLCNKVRRSGKLPGVTLNGSGRVKSVTKKKRKSKSDTTFNVSSYGNFQDHLDNRDELRSSILPEEIPKRVGAITPMKTPIKPVRRKVLAISTPQPPSTTRVLRTTPRNKVISTPKLIPIKNSSPV